jgi:hypothetical protein
MTWEDVEKLALTDPLVNAWLYNHRCGGLTREQVLCGMVSALCGQNKQLTDVLLDLHQRAPSPPIRVNATRFVPKEG